ncbi:MAG: PD40 domain-containing protein, partial [Acidobacteria bacterium]|nr:PD40 domain-containing protein [Acidobacteriota bacterium]
CVALRGLPSGEQPRIPAFLPDGRRIFFKPLAITTDVFVGSIDGSPPVKLAGVMSDSMVTFGQPGYLLYVRENTLLARPFDGRTAQVSGEAVPVAEDVVTTGPGYASFAASTTGTLTYLTGTSKADLAWYDRSGKRLASLPTPAGHSSDVVLSPDGAHIALSARGQGFDVWVIDGVRNSTSRLTFSSADQVSPTWSPDGLRIAFAERSATSVSLKVRARSGSGAEETLAANLKPTFVALWDWTRDGRFMVYGDNDPQTGLDIWALPLTGDRKRVPIVQGESIQVQASVSPDGRWLAYTSLESGKAEIYVQSFPSGGGRWQVSTNGGVQSRWRSDGKEIFFLGLDGTLMTAPITPGPSFQAGLPVPLFRMRVPGGPNAPAIGNYAPSADGQRFVVNMLRDEAAFSSYVVVLNWLAALRK